MKAHHGGLNMIQFDSHLGVAVEHCVHNRETENVKLASQID